ncbi:MAG: RNase adaptor protein RapZ [Betaproteobacteria bacterium RBG_19FT_COMBO_58_11]|nr:MAG: RNase adaptor protein RapZ [Betaproteobacteria bacterium RBG_19FT_COMBO_58_11]
MQVILITGLSGSGKSIALNVLEDNGYYCVDNLPVEMLPQLIELLQEEGSARVAVSIDARSGETLNQLPQQINALKHQGIDLRAMFLEANTETLVKRYSETRRRHPLSDGKQTISESIETERELLGKIAEIGHRMDTSDLSPNALRGWVKDFLGLDRSRITLLFESFGFKHGLPLDADFVFDVRCLPNPFYDPNLRPFTGKDQAVVDFIESQDDAIAMLADIRYYVEKWLPCFIRDNRAYLTVAIGCTGGQHRSVYFAEQLAERFRSEYQVLVRHRGLSV